MTFFLSSYEKSVHEEKLKLVYFYTYKLIKIIYLLLSQFILTIEVFDCMLKEFTWKNMISEKYYLSKCTILSMVLHEIYLLIGQIVLCTIKHDNLTRYSSFVLI